MNIEIKKSLSVLELSDLARIIEMQEKDITLVDLSYEKRLELLLETLIQERENRLINRLIRNAYFKYPSASLESLDYDSRQIKKSTILNLATMGFVANATNLVITGPTGAGKTYLACALGVEACRQTYRVLYIRMPDLMRNFENQSDNLRELTKYRKRIGNYQILILDEWLNYKLSEKDAKNLYVICVGIDVAKDKHDCFISNSDGEVLFSAFTIPNSREGFDTLFQRIVSVSDDLSKVKVGLEATGHYNYNLLGFLLDKGLATFVINPLHTNLYRKSLSLRQTKTDKVDAHTIASMLMSDVNLKSYSDTSYHNEELKSLTRYRFDKVKERAKLKTSVSRLISILFPELEKLVSTLHMASVYALLSEFPSAASVASAHLTRLTHLLEKASKGRYGKDTAILFREAARTSIGSHMPAKSLELKHTIRLIQELTAEIDEIETAIRQIMDEEIQSPILTIPGISYRMGAMIIAEIGDFSRFDSPDKILAYAGMSPSTYQSGQLDNCYSHMEKRGSRYLRYALYNATKYVCHWDETFAAYLAKKRAEGKHYNVAISHAAKKLVRVIYQLEKSGQSYHKAA